MKNEVYFETPENVQIGYEVAGQGTRFVAWFIDYLILGVALVIMMIVALILLVNSRRIGEIDLDPTSDKFESTLLIAGIFWVIASLGSFFYFGLSELLLRGQTIGKRSMGIRVVKSDGFSLDPSAIFVRSIFRVVDHLPPMWIVPVLHKQGQRLGDIVAGTIVVSDKRHTLGGLRENLMEGHTDRKFQFDALVLRRARPQDIQAVEKILERWGSLSLEEREQLLERIVPPLATRLQVEVPPPADRATFLEDFLAAEFRRQHRKLG